MTLKPLLLCRTVKKMGGKVGFRPQIHNSGRDARYSSREQTQFADVMAATPKHDAASLVLRPTAATQRGCVIASLSCAIDYYG